MALDLSVVIDNLPLFGEGALATVGISAAAIVGGLLVAFPVALLKLAPQTVVRCLATAYVEFFRNIPFIVLLSLFFYGLPFFGIRLQPTTTGILALAMFGSAYYAEIVRGAILSVHRGQMESARAIGMSYLRALWDIVFPQMLRFFIPAATNTSISLVKESAVLATLSVAELTYQGLIVQGQTYAPFEVFLATAAIYWVLTALLAAIFRRSETRISGKRKRGSSPRHHLAARYLSLEAEPRR